MTMFADLVIKSNAIFTSTADSPFSGAIAIKKHTIIHIEENADLSYFIGEETQVLDYGDKLVMPGFVDAHVHFILGALIFSDHICKEIGEAKTESECVEIMKIFAQSHADEKRLIGIGWFPANWNSDVLPTKKSLDEAFPDTPVYLIAADFHTLWLNSKALEESGYRKNSKPKNNEGEIGFFEDGSLNGLLFELGAFEPALKKIMDFDIFIMEEIFSNFLTYVTSCGVTSLSEMTGENYDEGSYRLYEIIKGLEDTQQLSARLFLYSRLKGYTDFSPALALKEKYNSDYFKLSGVKGLIDGVSSTFTALLLEPYTDRPDTCGIGVPLIPPSIMVQNIIAANKVGLPVRLHCIGDGAVRMGLDMFETSQKINDTHSFCNTIEHIESIHPSDIPRFKELNVIPSMQPYHLVLDQNEKIERIGLERCKWEWPHKSFLNEGATLAFGTDYPVVDMNPLLTIHAAITRKDDDGQETGINPEQCIRLSETLKAYTIGGAKAYGMAHKIGTLEKGKLADVVVLSHNLFDMTPEEILNTSVEATIVGGKLVYNK